MNKKKIKRSRKKVKRIRYINSRGKFISSKQYFFKGKKRYETYRKISVTSFEKVFKKKLSYKEKYFLSQRELKKYRIKVPKEPVEEILVDPEKAFRKISQDIRIRNFENRKRQDKFLVPRNLKKFPALYELYKDAKKCNVVFNDKVSKQLKKYLERKGLDFREIKFALKNNSIGKKIQLEKEKSTFVTGYDLKTERFLVNDKWITKIQLKKKLSDAKLKGLIEGIMEKFDLTRKQAFMFLRKSKKANIEAETIKTLISW